jgi:hypothetical protein
MEACKYGKNHFVKLFSFEFANLVITNTKTEGQSNSPSMLCFVYYVFCVLCSGCLCSVLGVLYSMLVFFFVMLSVIYIL